LVKEPLPGPGSPPEAPGDGCHRGQAHPALTILQNSIGTDLLITFARVTLPFLLLLLWSTQLLAEEIIGKVVAVTDGDTIKVLDSSYTEYKVRLSGIDAPERGQPHGTSSRDHLASLVAGKEVRVDWYKQDKYGRIVGKVWVEPADCPTCGKTLDASLAQVTDGMAWWYHYYAEEQSAEDRGRYESAEDEAKARGWGLWAEPNPISPYEWRKGKR